MMMFTYCIKVIPVLKGPLVFKTPTTTLIGLPFKYSLENTVQKIVIPQSRLNKKEVQYQLHV